MGGLLKQYMWIANIVVILFCSYFTAKIVNVYIGKALEVQRSIGLMKKAEKPSPVRVEHDKEYYNIITERDIFDSSDAPASDATAAKDENVEYVPGQDAVKTTLPVKLIAVLMVGSGTDERSSATVSMGKDIDVYAIGGEKTFSPGVRLVQIKPTRIEFVNKGRLEYASLEDEEGKSIFGPPTDGETAVASKKVTEQTETIAKVDEGKFQIDQREIDNALNNLDKLYTEIRAIPNFKDGKVSGMKVLSVKPGSLFAKLGLKRGDILSRINGIELDVRKGFDIFTQLKDQKKFNVDLIRGGTTQTFDYDIK